MDQALAVPFSKLKAAFRAGWKIVHPAWSHRTAQMYELQSAEGSTNRAFADLYARIEAERAAGGLWQTANDRLFQGDQKLFAGFVEHVRTRACLEIGSGPFGYLPPCHWIKRRIIVDPLVAKYRDHQMSRFGSTLFTPDVETHATPAEQIIPSLIGKIDGAIVCQNALDHTEDPIGILHAISEYAAPGCYFLFWTDLWHHDGGDIGHRNITKSVDVMPKILSGLGFEILTLGDPNRSGETVEFGCLARKR